MNSNKCFREQLFAKPKFNEKILRIFTIYSIIKLYYTTIVFFTYIVFLCDNTSLYGIIYVGKTYI